MHQTGTNGVLKDVRCDNGHVFVKPKKVIPEAELPESALYTKLPGRSLSKILELTNERDDVT